MFNEMMPGMNPALAFSDGMVFMQNLSLGHIGMSPAPMSYGAMMEHTMEPYDTGRAKFLEIQRKEWEYTPPSPFTSNHYKDDFAWMKPITPVEPIMPKPMKFDPFKPMELIKPPEPIMFFEPIKPLKQSYENPDYLNIDKKGKYFDNGFGFQPINDIFPKKGSMHDSFNVNDSGSVLNGHTTIDLRGTTKKVRMPWEMDLSQKTNLFNKY